MEPGAGSARGWDTVSQLPELGRGNARTATRCLKKFLAIGFGVSADVLLEGMEIEPELGMPKKGRKVKLKLKK